MNAVSNKAPLPSRMIELDIVMRNPACIKAVLSSAIKRNREHLERHRGIEIINNARQVPQMS
jgi:hypothetical protein